MKDNKLDNTWILVVMLALSAILSANTPYDEVFGQQSNKYNVDRWICPHCSSINDGEGGWCSDCGRHHSSTQKEQNDDDKPTPYRDEWDEWPY